MREHKIVGGVDKELRKKSTKRKASDTNINRNARMMKDSLVLQSLAKRHLKVL